MQSLQYNSVCAGFFIIVCLCSDLISSVFPALSCCLLHLWSHPEGRCRTESVPLHVGDTQYVLYSVYSVLYIILYSIHYVIQYSNLLLRLCVCLQTTVHGLKLQKGRTWMLWRTCSTLKANSNSVLWRNLSPVQKHAQAWPISIMDVERIGHHKHCNDAWWSGYKMMWFILRRVHNGM